MRKVLIITYYWPPSAGGGVQRWLKFSKYLRDFGYEPIIYTPENPTAPALDPGLEKDIPRDLTVIKRPILEPYQWYKLFTGRRKKDMPGAAFASEDPGSFAEKLANWVRSNFFIPDARVLWVKPSVKFLKNFLRKQPVDLIVSTGPPHSMHLIAMKLRMEHGIPWIADFRDPWTGIDFFDELLLTARARKKHKRLEREVLSHADHIITVSQANKEAFRRMGFDRVSVITNGYDPDDFVEENPEPDKSFTLAHIGTFMYNRNPDTLWQVLGQLKKENPGFADDLRIKLAGKIDRRIIEDIRQNGLADSLIQKGYLSHSEAIRELKRSQLLLLVINKTGNNKGMLTGKVFEYISSGRPILCIGPKGSDVEKLLEDTKTGILTEMNDAAGLKENILHFYTAFKKGKLNMHPVNLEPYSRKNLSEKLSVIFDKLVEKTFNE